MKHLFVYILIISFSFSSHSQDWQTQNLLYDKAKSKGLLDSMLIYSEKSLKQAEIEFGKKHKNYLQSQGNLAAIYQKKGMFLNAEKLYKENVEIRKELYGDKHPNYANGLNSLAGLYIDEGKYEESEPLYNLAIEIYKNSLGEQHQNYANTLFNLGRLYYFKGNYSLAEPCYVKAMEITRQLNNDKTLNYAQFVNDVAVMYRKMGNEEKAVENYEKAIELFKSSVGTKHPDYLKILNNLASIYNDKKEYEKAEKNYLEVIALQKILIGTSHPDYIITLNNIAGLYNNMEQYEKAAPYLQEAMALGEKTVGKNHPYYASTLSYLANLAISQKDFAGAEKHLIECLSLREQTLGKNHPLTAKTMYDLAVVSFETEKMDDAEQYFRKMIDARLFQVKNNFEYLSEEEKDKYWKTIKKELDVFYSFAMKRKFSNEKIAEILFDFHISTKGILFNSSVQMRNVILNSNDNKLLQMYDEWVGIKNILGQLNMLSPEDVANRKLNKDSINDKANALEKELFKNSDLFTKKISADNITWKNIQSKLNDDEVMLAFVDFQQYQNLHFTDTIIYIALLINKESTCPQIIRIENENTISKYIENTISNSSVSDYVLSQEIASHLYKAVWKPIEPFVENKKRVFISLSGVLNKISFSILRNAKKELLIEKHEICVLNHPKNIIRCKNQTVFNQKEVYLFGGVKYDTDFPVMIDKAKPYYRNFNPNLIQIDSLGKNIGLWDFLPGTAIEAENIINMLKQKSWNYKFFSGADANEEAFKKMNQGKSPTVLHLATHGFFFSDNSSNEAVTRNSFESNKNPLFRSGIVLAGGNNAWQEKRVMGIEDGILTAYEVSNCNLLNTEVVVMSACETGLGDIKSGEGVYGLQRAFQIAGARSIIMSLWNVPDKETIELMSLFYQKLVDTGNVRTSFREAQQEMQKKYEPFFWAAFVLME